MLARRDIISCRGIINLMVWKWRMENYEMDFVIKWNLLDIKEKYNKDVTELIVENR